VVILLRATLPSVPFLGVLAVFKALAPRPNGNY
jgi:hypothetical protein